MGTGTRHPTMRDVAELAGVSPMTVSRALHRDPNVAPDSVRSVFDAVERLGYRRNEVARALRTGRAHDLIGLVITNLANPFYARLAEGVDRIAAMAGLHILIGNSRDDAARERELLEDFRSQRVSGLVVVPSGTDQSHLTAEHVDGVPVVLAARPPNGVDLDCVLVDDETGTRDLTNSLARAGHRRIGFVGLPRSTWAGTRRLAGYHRGLAESGIPFDEHLETFTDRLAHDAPRATSDLLDQPDPPTALVTANNRITVGAYRAIRTDHRVVALAGFDDIELGDLLEPGITVAAYDPSLIGETAASLVLSRLGLTGKNIDRGTQRHSLPVTIRDYHGLEGHTPAPVPDGASLCMP